MEAWEKAVLLEEARKRDAVARYVARGCGAEAAVQLAEAELIQDAMREERLSERERLVLYAAGLRAEMGDGDACGAEGDDGISGLTGGEGDLRSMGAREAGPERGPGGQLGADPDAGRGTHAQQPLIQQGIQQEAQGGEDAAGVFAADVAAVLLGSWLRQPLGVFGCRGYWFGVVRNDFHMGVDRAARARLELWLTHFRHVHSLEEVADAAALGYGGAAAGGGTLDQAVQGRVCAMEGFLDALMLYLACPFNKKVPFLSDIAGRYSVLEELLVEKNRLYGDSALAPVGVMFRGDWDSAIRVRMDDKIKRLLNLCSFDDPEDTVMDLAGYVVLWLVGQRRERALSGKFAHDTHG